jgi:hypothetical protein
MVRAVIRLTPAAADLRGRLSLLLKACLDTVNEGGGVPASMLHGGYAGTVAVTPAMALGRQLRVQRPGGQRLGLDLGKQDAWDGVVECAKMLRR